MGFRVFFYGSHAHASALACLLNKWGQRVGADSRKDRKRGSLLRRCLRPKKSCLCSSVFMRFSLMYSLSTGNAYSVLSSSQYLWGCPLCEDFVNLILSLQPGEYTTWCTGLLGGVAKLFANCFNWAEVKIWDGSVGRPASVHTLRFEM